MSPSEKMARPANPTVAQVREVCQPPEVVGRNTEHWVGDLFHRRLSPYVTRWFIKLHFSANAVTVVMILIGWVAAAAVMVPGIVAALAAAVLGQLQMFIDCTDGEVARWNDQRSPKGIFLDKIAHYTTEAFIALALGVRAAGDFSVDSGWILLGAVFAVLLLLNKSLNDFVHVARAQSGLAPVDLARQSRARPQSLIGWLRRAAAFVPFYKLFHSIELTLLIAVAAVIDVFVGGLDATRVLLVGLTVLMLITIVGHLVSILASSKLSGEASSQ